MLKRFSKYVFQSVASMMGQSVYILADTFFISVSSGADGLAVLNLILPVFGMMLELVLRRDTESTEPKVKRQIIILHSHSAGRYFLVFHLCWLEFSFRINSWHFSERMQV